MPKFIIFSPEYDENIGGVIVLHKLCHLLNSIGVEAYLYPEYKEYKISIYNLKNIPKVLEKIVKKKFSNYKVNCHFNTPVYSGDITDDDVVIYSELVMGNPLNSNNVVRWLLHKPGYHSGEYFFGIGEIFFKFDRGLVDDFFYYKSKVSNLILNILHLPEEYYNTNDTPLIRDKVAYSVRKGNGKKLDKHPDDAICIDGLSHAQVAKIFKSCYEFISYDAYSAYSIFAVLCGCDSIIVPDKGVSLEDWYPDPCKRYGLSYGRDNIIEARKTAKLKLEYLDSLEQGYKELVEKFASEVLDYYNLN